MTGYILAPRKRQNSRTVACVTFYARNHAQFNRQAMEEFAIHRFNAIIWAVAEDRGSIGLILLDKLTPNSYRLSGECFSGRPLMMQFGVPVGKYRLRVESKMVSGKEQRLLVFDVAVNATSRPAGYDGTNNHEGKP